MLAELARTISPVTLAGVRRLAVRGELEALLPAGGVQRGSVVAVGGVAGCGVTTVAFQLAAATTACGEWVACLDAGSFGGMAALRSGVDLERCAVVRNVPDARWPVVVGALLDGVSMVIAGAPHRLALGDARRLQARARERQATLVVLETVAGAPVGVWPAEAALRIEVGPSSWHASTGHDAGAGVHITGGMSVDARALVVMVTGKGLPPRSNSERSRENDGALRRAG